MPNFKQITEARQKAKRIREHAAEFRAESARMEEAIKETQHSRVVSISRKSSLKSDHVRPVGRVA